MKYSWQRQIILETIQEHKEHLSAQQIYGYARERCPHISLGTVYRNLRQLAREGRLLELDGPVARFDAVTAPHTHFRCDCCGAVLDLDMPYDAGLDARAGGNGCQISGHSLCFNGICPACAGNKHITI